MTLNWYLFGGYVVVWTAIFFFLVVLNRRQKALQDELGRLADHLERD